MPRFRPHSLWRSRAPFGVEEARRTERWLATARVFLASSALLTAWMDPGEIRSVWGYFLLDFYVIHGIGITLLLRSRQRTTLPFRLLVHGADVVLPAVLLLFTTGQSPFFLFFVFVIAAAAYRWGVWETVVTSLASVSVLWLESLGFQLGEIRAMAADPAVFEPKRLFMHSIYLVVMGLLLGYLAEQQKKLRAEKDQTAKMLSMVRLDEGLAGTLSHIVGELLKLYAAPRALIASREGASQKVWVGVLESKNEMFELEWVDAGAGGFETYLADTLGSSFYVSAIEEQGHHRDFYVLHLEPSGLLKRDPSTAFAARFSDIHPFRRLMGVSYSFGPELAGRIFLLEPMVISNTEEELQFLENLVRQIGPAIYNVYLLRRLRRKAGALERARLVRELHDGAVQSLIAVEMQVDVLRRTHPMADGMASEIYRVQQLLREEVMKLRELMYQMKSSDMDARRLPGFLRDTVQRFQRETGITARFLMDGEEVTLPRPICRELARIAQEALVNVRKHSGANRVIVQLVEGEEEWELIVEDDGAGFPFTGRFSQSELDAAGRAPGIIRERVRLIEGDLTIESSPGRGSRVEVRVPRVPEPQSATLN
jgi:signal transduction histidine kinase